ncbi:MAG: hypothetical protein LBM02_07360 [Lachnospiraceae bacterium]|jgi:hypothetical protein|nr:hypothetical protein [Lachnospiraceae bacterium]
MNYIITIIIAILSFFNYSWQSNGIPGVLPNLLLGACLQVIFTGVMFYLLITYKGKKTTKGYDYPGERAFTIRFGAILCIFIFSLLAAGVYILNLFGIIHML